jgi:hypothetical protein
VGPRGFRGCVGTTLSDVAPRYPVGWISDTARWIASGLVRSRVRSRTSSHSASLAIRRLNAESIKEQGASSNEHPLQPTWFATPG